MGRNGKITPFTCELRGEQAHYGKDMRGRRSLRGNDTPQETSYQEGGGKVTEAGTVAAAEFRGSASEPTQRRSLMIACCSWRAGREHCGCCFFTSHALLLHTSHLLNWECSNI